MPPSRPGAAGVVAALGCVLMAWPLSGQERGSSAVLGSERAVARHLQDGDEFRLPLADLIAHGKALFSAAWTDQDGAGRPLATGTGARLSDRAVPLSGPRAFNRISGPDANACRACHNRPAGMIGGAGDVVSSVFEMAQRFDFVTFDPEEGRATSLQTVGNLRSAPSLFGAGYIEVLARQITADLQRIRDTIAPDESKLLTSKGISFGTLARRASGQWDVRGVEGLPPQSVAVGAGGKPSLVIRPWHQSGSVVSLREFTAAAFNHHHGIQTTERFGVNTDSDGDGVVNELTRADLTAVTVFLATLPVPGRVIPDDPQIAQAVTDGQRVFHRIRCTACHVPSLPLTGPGAIYREPGPFNAQGALRASGARVLAIDLNSPALPQPRLSPSATDRGTTYVPAYTDFKLHDITDPADESAQEPLDMNQPPSSPRFAARNRRFLTRRLWDVGSHPAHFHDGRFTTIRQALLAHAGEALEQRRAFERLGKYDQDALIEFLKSLQLVAPATQ